MTKRDFVKSLAESNRQFYGTPEGNGVLRALDLTFENRWIYLFELVQNALNAKANSISLRLAEDDQALIFQHDGQTPIKRTEVSMFRFIHEHVQPRATVYTDGYPVYDNLWREGFDHEKVIHRREYARGEVHVNGIEGFWQPLRGASQAYITS